MPSILLFFLIIIGCLFFLVGIVVLLRVSMLVVTINGPSMSPLLAHGDRVLVLRRWLSGRFHRGEIVVVKPPSEQLSGLSQSSSWYVKRITALGGETFTPPSYDPLPSNVSQEDAFALSPKQRVWPVPPEHLFICGDNRAKSIDSRHWGPIPFRSVIGVVLIKLSRASVAHTSTHKHALVARPAPFFSAEALDGTTVALDRYHSQPVLLLFIANTSVSAERLPSFLTLAQKLIALGTAVLFVCDEQRNHAEALVAAIPIPYPVLVAPRAQNPLLKDYDVVATPAFCLIDAQGIVQASGFPNQLFSDWKAISETASREEISSID